MSPISRFEALAQRLVEGSLSRLLGGRLEPLEVATRIAHAMEDGRRRGIATGAYHVHLQPDDYAALLTAEPDLSTILAAYVTDLARQAGIVLTAPLSIVLSADPALRPRQVTVTADESVAVGQDTQIYAPEDEEAGVIALLQAVDAYLIVAGKRHIPLTKPMLTIGRRTDNDIVIDAPTVSRRHAQLRWRYGRFVLYDLESRGGTTVNGQRVGEAVLQPGDIIVLSDVPLIYGEGVDGREAIARPDDPLGQTQPFDPKMRRDGGRPSG